jgi:pyruvate dehydrogenase (quinone)
MSEMTGEHFVERLEEWGPKTIFGYPGDRVNKVLDGLEKTES